MGGLRNKARLWVIAGVAVAVLLGIGGWFLLIGPKYNDAASVGNQADATRVQIGVLEAKLAGLRKKQAQLNKFKAKLKANRAALPTDSGVPDFLRQLQASGDLTDVTVTALTVAAPVQTVGVAGVWQLQMTLNAMGAPDDLSKFVDKVQEQQSRAVLIQSANLTEATAPSAGTSSTASTTASPTPSASPTATRTRDSDGDYDGDTDGVVITLTPTASPSPSASDALSQTTLSLSLLAFVAPPAGSGAPVVTTPSAGSGPTVVTTK